MVNLTDFLKRRSKEPAFDPHDVELITSGDWEDVIEQFTEDMDPWAIDIVKLADRYKSYIEKLERFDLDVPGRVILVGAVLLRMKAEVLREYEDGPKDEDGIEELDEYDEMMDMFDAAEEELDEVEESQLRIPEAIPEPPVKKSSNRKVTLDELKGALDKAMSIDESRSQRQKTRKEAKDYGIEVEEQDIQSKLESLYSSLRDRLGASSDAVTFSDLAAQEAKDEQIDKFVNLMHLETEERIECAQPEFLGELTIKVKDAELQNS